MQAKRDIATLGRRGAEQPWKKAAQVIRAGHTVESILEAAELPMAEVIQQGLSLLHMTAMSTSQQL